VEGGERRGWGEQMKRGKCNFVGQGQLVRLVAIFLAWGGGGGGGDGGGLSSGLLKAGTRIEANQWII